jgi:hypothetical protein
MSLRFRKKSRYQQARTALKKLLPARRTRPARRRDREEVTEPNRDYGALHWMTAGLFVAAGAEAALGERRGDYRPDPVRWAPFVVAPIAGAAQAARALWPSDTTRVIAQLANGIALGVGAAGLASTVSDVVREHRVLNEAEHDAIEHVPSLAPLAFGAVGLLALLLDNEDDDVRPARLGPPKRVIIRV